MWNYTYIIPSFLVLIIFMVYYLVMPHLSIRKNRTFLWILALEGLIMFSDILSSKADENFPNHSVGLLYILNITYFVLFLIRPWMFFRFTSDLLQIRWECSNWRDKLALILAETIILSSFVTGAVFRIGTEGYERGPCYNILYLCFLFYIAYSLILLGKYHTRLNRFELVSAVAYQLILLIGNAVRFLMPKYLVMNTFCLLAVIVIYLSFENPDLYLEYRGNAFNLRAFREVLYETVGNNNYRMLAFVLRNYHDSRGIYGGTQMDQGIALISQYLAKTYPEYTVFYLRSGRFALLGTEAMDWDRVREKIYERFEEPWYAADAEVDLNVSFVQMGADSQMDTVDRVINDLYLALEKAGERESFGDQAIDLESIREIDWQVDVKRSLEKALEQDEVEIFLQPLVDAKSRKVVSAEALARIRDADGKLVMPGIFIPIAEKNGRIMEMGEQVFEKTCQFIRDHDLSDLGISWINVNLSPIQCMRKDLSERFDSILNQYGVDADRIHLEITEESMVDFTLLLKRIQDLQGKGFQFVLDDYGSGYSNLTRVKRCPFINIKLDMELVWDYFRERDVLLPTIVQTFKQMNFSVTAEGIETAEMADAMSEMGCDYLQGFYFSKPLPTEEFIRKYGRAGSGNA